MNIRWIDELAGRVVLSSLLGVAFCLAAGAIWPRVNDEPAVVAMLGTLAGFAIAWARQVEVQRRRQGVAWNPLGGTDVSLLGVFALLGVLALTVQGLRSLFGAQPPGPMSLAEVLLVSTACSTWTVALARLWQKGETGAVATRDEPRS